MPETLLGRDRQSLDTDSEAALGAEVTRATARYEGVTIALTDFQTTEMTEMMGHAGLAASPDRLLGYPVQRERSAGSASTTVLVDGRALVKVTASTEALTESALAALNLAELQR